MTFDPLTVSRDEDRFREQLRQTPDWSLAERASMALAQVLDAAPRQTYEGPLEAAGPALQHHAQFLIGIRVFRAVRAAMAALSVGYEPEARALERVLIELATHRDLIRADPSGQEALRWLRGEAGQGITEKVRAWALDDLYGDLSQEAHGDPRPVWRLYEEASDSLIFGPQTHAFVSRYSLITYAGTACGQLKLLARLSDVDSAQGADLDAEVRAAWRRARDDAYAVQAALQ